MVFSFSIIITHVFKLQIIKGSEYSEGLKVSIEKTMSVPGHAEGSLTEMEKCWLMMSLFMLSISVTADLILRKKKRIRL